MLITTTHPIISPLPPVAITPVKPDYGQAG